MGGSESKNAFAPNSLRLSKRRSRSLPSLDEVGQIEVCLKTINSDVKSFNGLRDDQRYCAYQKALADYAQRLTTIRSSVKRSRQQKCDNLKWEIQNLVTTLEDKVRANEDNLDLETVESTSFINHSVAKKNGKENNAFKKDDEDDVFYSEAELRKSGRKEKSLTSERTKKRNQQIDELQKRFGPDNNRRSAKTKSATWQRDPRANTLNGIADNARKLEAELQNAASLQDNRLFTILEKKILILLTDLEMVRVDKYAELQARKEEISETLIQLNNKARRAKQGLGRRTGSNNRDTIISEKTEIAGKTIKDLYPIADDVDILEMKANSLQGTKSSDDYKNVKQSATNHWAKLEETSTADEDAYKYKQQIKERIKALLHTLNERAIQNERTIQAELYELDIIKTELAKLKGFVEEFHDNTKNERYEFIDQNLRKLWANLTKVKESTEDVTALKKTIIDEIQEALKALSDKVATKEPIYAQIVHKTPKTKPSEVLNQLKQLNNLLNRQTKYFSNPDLTSLEKDELETTLETIGQAVKEQLQTLKKENEKNKQNGFEKPSYIEKQNNDKKQSNFETQNYFEKQNHIEKQNYVEKQNPVKQNTGDKQNHVVKQNTIEKQNPIENQPQYKPNNVNDIKQNLNNPQQNLKKPETPTDKKELNIVNDKRTSMITNLDNFSYDYKPVNYTPVYAKDETDKPFKINDEKTEYINIQSTIKPNGNDDKINELKKQLTSNLPGKELNYNVNVNKKIEKTSKDSLDEIMKIDAIVQNLKKQITNYQSAKKDKEYSDIEDALMESVITLNVVDTMGINNLKTAKDEVMKQIRDLQVELPKKLLENESKQKKTNSETAELKSLIEQVQGLKKKVDCFSGMYRSVQYAQIEDGLNLCLQKLSAIDCNGNEKALKAKEQTKQKVAQYLKILDEKSLKAERPNNRVSASISYSKLEGLRNDLVKIKSDIEMFEGKYKDSKYEVVMANLQKAAFDLESIEDHGSESMKASIHQYRDYIAQLTTYFEEKLEFSQ